MQCNLIFETVPPFQLPKTSLVSCIWSVVTNKKLGMCRYITEGVYAKAFYVPYLYASGWILVEFCDWNSPPVSICIHCVFFYDFTCYPGGDSGSSFLCIMTSLASSGIIFYATEVMVYATADYACWNGSELALVCISSEEESISSSVWCDWKMPLIFLAWLQGTSVVVLHDPG